MELDRDDVLVLKALRHGAADALELPGSTSVVARLVELGLVRDDRVVPTLTGEGAEVAAKLERRWPA